MSSGSLNSMMMTQAVGGGISPRPREVRLLAPDGRPVPELLLHIEGDAWWRWSDKPFPQAGDNP
jgi:hypothetical protein